MIFFHRKRTDVFPFFPSLHREPPNSKHTTSFLKVVVFQKHYWLTCCLSTLLEMGLNIGGEKKPKKQPESAVHIHQDE